MGHIDGFIIIQYCQVNTRGLLSTRSFSSYLFFSRLFCLVMEVLFRLFSFPVMKLWGECFQIRSFPGVFFLSLLNLHIRALYTVWISLFTISLFGWNFGILIIIVGIEGWFISIFYVSASLCMRFWSICTSSCHKCCL